MAIVDMDGTIEYINPKATETFGYLPEDIPNMERWFAQAYPDAAYRQEVITVWMGLVNQAIDEGHEIPRRDYKVTCKDGTVKTVGIFGMPVSGKVFVMFDDITERKQTDQRLRKSEADFRAILEGSLDVAYRRDLKRDRYDYLSPSIETISGFSVDEFSRMSFAALQERFHPDDRVALQERVQRSLAGEPVSGTFEYRFQHKAGPYHWFSDCSTVVLDAAGNPIYHVGIVRDVTEVKQLETALRENEQRLSALLNASTEPIMLLDCQGCLIVANEAFGRLFGTPVATLLGHPIPSLGPSELVRNRAERFRQVFQSRQPVRFEDTRGDQFFDNNFYPLLGKDGQVTAVAVYSRNITARKTAELALLQANAELEKKVRDRTAQIRALASELTLAEQKERKRVSGILHDNIQQLLIAARYRLGGLNQVRNKKTQQILAQVDDLIGQAITCSRTLSGELSPPILQTGGLEPALEWLASWMENNHGLKVGLSFRGRVQLQKDGILTLLFQVIRELLLNVVKHAQTQTAHVEVIQVKQVLRVIVSDQGVGFDPKTLMHSSGRATGFGLLSIRERLQLLGGSMEIESAPHQGSRLTLLAPSMEEGGLSLLGNMDEEPSSVSVSTPKAVAEAAGSVRKVRLLVVDDHAVVRQSFVQLLNVTSDLEVVGEASCGAEAIAMVNELHPDIVTMDINMKDMDGIETTRRIHAQFPQVRILGLSMFEEEESAKAMLQAGAVDYLTKSSPASDLIAAIHRAARTETASA